MSCAPQRFLANDRNLAAAATLTPSSVEPVEDQVLPIPLARVGTADATLSGAYDGEEEAEYEIEIVDTTPTVPVISAPISSGAGSSRLVGISATGLDAQTILVELVDAGKPATYAAVSFEGVRLQARAIGSGGNAIRVSIDQSGLTFTATDYSLLEDLAAGQGGPTGGLEGAGFDWDTAALGADDLIPTSAHRLVFGDDRSTIYLQYKKYQDNRWTYHFVPELRRAIPKGTPIYFVTGGRVVTITDGVTPETYSSVETVYDLLSQVRAASALVSVEGVVALDRSPAGQASQELLVRTDAHVEPSTGSGSSSATGFEDTFANSNARTELVVATCYAITGRDHPLAQLGKERWYVRSSLGGDLGEAVSGVPFVEAESRFGFTIPQKLPPGYGDPKGAASVNVSYVARSSTDPEEPPICATVKLGAAASDLTWTLKWTKRPSGDCDCSGLPIPPIGGRCLGTLEEGNSDMGYSNANRLRLVALYEWLADFVRSNSQLNDTGSSPVYTEGAQDPVIAAPEQPDSTYIRESLREIVGWFEDALAQIDELEDGLSPDLKTEGEGAWDTAFAELQADVDAIATGNILLSLPNDRYRSRLDQVLITAGISPLGKTDASILESGDGCWRDNGDSYYFTVTASDGRGFAPLFANVVYYTSARASDRDRYYSTRELGILLNVKCPQNLKEGDTVTIGVGGAGYPATYNIGDTITLPVIAAADLYLAGGRDDDSTQTWSVTGDVDGPFAPWTFVPGASATGYSDGGLSFDIEAGGIPNEKGDRFSFAIEGGHFRWRKDGGAWSSSLDIPTTAVALDSGLSLVFVPGAAPSYSAGDLYQFRALQPWAVSNVQTPRPEAWRWATSTGGATLEVDVGEISSLDTVAIAMHTIPSGATLSISGGDATPDEWTESITWREGLIVQPLSQLRSARYLRLTLADADAGQIGWLWAGEALDFDLSADVQIRGAFRVARADGPLFQGGSTLGKTKTATISWSEGALSEADALAIAETFDYCKGNDDQPLIVLPHVSRPGDAVFGRFLDDELEVTEMSGQNRNDSARRRYSTSFRIQGVWAQ